MKLRTPLLAALLLAGVAATSRADDGARFVALTLARITALTGTGSTAATNFGLGTASLANTGTTGANVPLLNGANTWGATQTFPGAGTGTHIIFPSGLVGTATPDAQDYGGTYSTALLANPKLLLLNGGGLVYGFGVSANSFDYMAPSGASHTFGVAGVPALKVTANGLQVPKLTAAPTTAPGAGFAYLYLVPGTNSGTCKLQTTSGTSTTPVTIVDNIGAGC